MAEALSVESLWTQVWERGFQNIYVFAIPEYTEVLAFTDAVRLYYDGVDPLFCDACGGYLERQEDGRYAVETLCPHVIKAEGATLALALESVLSVR